MYIKVNRYGPVYTEVFNRMKILAIKLRRLGDSVIWTSALQGLTQHFPDAEIDAVFPEPYEALFQTFPGIKTLYPLPGDKRSINSFGVEWVSKKYDHALVFHASAFPRNLARLAKAKQTLIHHHSRKPTLYGSDLPIPHLGKPMPATERDLNVVRALGFAGPIPAPRILCLPQWKERMAQRWRDAARSDSEFLLVVCPGASRLSKKWPLENYAQLIESLPPSISVAVVAPNEAEFQGQDYFVRRIQRRGHFIFTPRLEDAMGIVSNARLFLGSDSGMKHVAAALGIPTITLFGPESVGEWHPYPSDPHLPLRAAVGCRTQDPQEPLYAWCGVPVCPLASHACMSQITPAKVLHAIQRYL